MTRMWQVAGTLLACVLAMAAYGLERLPMAPVVSSLGVDDGLPSSRINALLTDRLGYLWIATDDGLARYDGVAFRVWQVEPGVEGALPGNSVQSLLVDSRDRVWVAPSEVPPVVLDEARRVFSPIAGWPAEVVDVMAFAETPDGAVWAATFASGLLRVDAQGGLRWFRAGAADAPGLPADQVLDLRTDADGRLWVATGAGLVRFEDDRFVPAEHEGLSGAPVWTLSATPDGDLWISTADRRLWRRGRDGRIEVVAWTSDLGGALVRQVLADPQGGHWLSTTRGLYFVDARGVHGFPGTPVASANLLGGLQDADAGLWIADTENGLFRLPGLWRHFAALQQRNGSPWSPGAREINGLAAARGGGAWLAGNGPALARLRADGQAVEPVAGLSPEIGTRLLAVLETGDGSLWLGEALGLHRRDPSGQWQRWARGSEGGAPAGAVDLLVAGQDGSVWLSAYGGGLQHRAADGRLLREMLPGDGQGLESPMVEQLWVAGDGALWVAGRDGLLRWNGQRFDVLLDGRSGAVQAVAPGRAGDLWVYRSGLLQRYRLDPSRLVLLDEATSGNEGIPAAEAGGLLVDGQGRVWITTVRGLYRFDPAARVVRRFGRGDGLPSSEFSLRPPMALPGGVMLAGTVDGAVLFDPDRLPDEIEAPPLRIETLGARRGEDALAFPVEGPAVLAAGDRDLRIVARLLSYAEPRLHRYRFRLRGYDPDWVEATMAGERVWSRLEPGQYLLDVVASRGDGQWRAAPSIAVRVLPPWTQTWPAYAIYAGVAMGLLWSLWWFQRERARRRAREELAGEQRRLALQASEAKSRFLANLGHEIRTPLTGVLGMAELLLRSPLPEGQRQQARTVQQAGQHLLRLVNDALDMAKIEAGKLVLLDDRFEPRPLFDGCMALLAPVAETKELALHLVWDPGVPVACRGDAGRVRQIVLNLVGNALKFTESGEVTVRVSPAAGGGFVFAVIDTGPGMSEDQCQQLFRRFEQADGGRTAARYGGSGLGLAISQELAQAMKGRISVASVLGQGTTFTVVLPLPLAPSGVIEPARSMVVASRPRRLLLVEDDPIVAEVVAGLLQAEGHAVEVAGQALDALARIQGSAFDLAILDLDLPGVSGLELAGLLRLQAPALPLVALTARADGEAEAEARDAGLVAFLRKPVDGDTLAAVVNAYARED